MDEWTNQKKIFSDSERVNKWIIWLWINICLGGRQRIWLRDNIEEWTTLKFADSQVAARDRDTWRQITIRSAKYASTTWKRVETKKNV